MRTAFSGYDVVVRPRPTLLRSTALSVLFSAVPLGVALVWVSLPLQLWAVVAGIVVVIAVATLFVVVRVRSAYVGVGAQRFELRSVFSRRVALDRADVDRIVLATTYGGSVDRTTRELLALSTSGRTVFRMRGDLWEESGMTHVANAFDVQITDIRKPMPLREFHRMFPTSREWYGGRRGLLLVGLVAVVVVASALAAEVAGLLPR